MKIKNFISVLVILLIVAAVVIYLIALDNRYKQIYGKDYFDILTGRTVKAESSGPGEVILEYPLLNSEYKIEENADINSVK